LFREWIVSTPAGAFRVTYYGHGFGFESVSVDGVVAVRTRSLIWYVSKFNFRVGGLPATVEVRVWPWLTLRGIRLHIADEVCYSEGSL